MSIKLVHAKTKRGLTRAKPKPLPKLRRKLAEGRAHRVLRPNIPKGKGDKRVEKSPATETAPTGPDDRRIVFETYTPDNPSNGGPIPPDPSGANSAKDVVLYCGNSYLMASIDGGSTFKEHDTTAFLPAAVGRPVDQVIIYVPHRNLYAWMMQHGKNPAGDGTFRLAVADADELKADVESAWRVYDFTASDLGRPGSFTDRQDLAFSETRLYMTTNTNKGRIVMTLSLDDLVARHAVSWGRTDPLDGMFQFSDLSQQNSQNVHSVAIADSSTLRVMLLDDGAGTYDFHDVTVAQFPIAADLSSLDPNGIDWLTRGVANVSASVVSGEDLWVAWDAAASAAGDNPSFPNAHIRMARISRRTWHAAEERQVWNPDYAFAYGCMAVGFERQVGYGVAYGGNSNFPNSCFGILGDFVVYFRDDSTATAGASGEPRWGDYITVRPSETDQRRFAAFGYFIKDDGAGGANQTPYFLSYGRP